MFCHGNVREITLLRLPKDTIRSRERKYGEAQEKTHYIQRYNPQWINSPLLQKLDSLVKIARFSNGDSNHHKLDRCYSHHSIWYSRGFGALPFFILKPKLRIENPRVAISNEGSHSEFKDAYFVIHNFGKRQARNIRIRAKPFFVEDIRLPRWDDFKTLNPDFPSESKPFDLDPEQKVSVKLCQVRKGDRLTILHCEQGEMPTLDAGQTYEVLIRFTGRNFSDRKIWHLRLNLNYESLNLEIRS